MSEQDKAEILAMMKAEGLDATEESVKALTKAAFKVVAFALPKVNVAVAAIVLPILALVEPKVLELEDKIDGKVG